MEISSDCAPAREHPQNEKFSTPREIRLTDSSNVAAPFSSVYGLLQATPKGDFATFRSYSRGEAGAVARTKTETTPLIAISTSGLFAESRL
jgi:hypothetical protein